MKINYIVLFLCMSGAAVYAQKITPTVLSSAGAVMKNNNNSIEWTLGEIATETIKSNNNSISQGFHQTNLTIVSTNNPGITGLQIYPNPVQDDLIIENQSGKSVTIHVITMNGQCITEEKFEPGTQNLKMNSMPAGSYIIEALSGSQKHNLVIEKIK